MSSPTRKRAPTQGAFRSRTSKKLDNEDNTLNPKKSFQNLRQLFKLPARVLTPFSSSKKDDEQRGRAPMVNPAEPKTHRLLGEISPTRARVFPSTSNTAPNLRKLASRNASAMLHSSPLRNVSEPLPMPRFPQPDYDCYDPINLTTPLMRNGPPPAQNISRYTVVTDLGREHRLRSPPRKALTETNRHINSPQLQHPRTSLGARNISTPFTTYASRPTTSASQQITPPRPLFANGKHSSFRAERSLSMLNQENRRNTLYSSTRPLSITGRENLVTPRQFRNSVSSLIQASAATTASTHPASPPKALFTTNPRYIYTAQPNPYWAGRFTVLHDKFHNQMLAAAVNDPHIRRHFQRPDSKLQKSKPESSKTKSSTKDLEDETPPRDDEQAIRNDEVRRCKRVFYTLQSLCVTDEAKQSLWEFQLKFARERKMEACLPDGGKMEPAHGIRWTRITHLKTFRREDSGIGETF